MSINKQVSVIGNARLSKALYINMAREVGRVIAQEGFHLVCGGLGGVMLESCRGFKSISGVGRSIGILPDYESQRANPFVDVVIPTGLDVGRNQLVVASGFAVVVVGGGAGTLSEIALAAQIGRPILLMKGSGGWADRLDCDYLDERKTTPLLPIHSSAELLTELKKIAQQKECSHYICEDDLSLNI